MGTRPGFPTLSPYHVITLSPYRHLIRKYDSDAGEYHIELGRHTKESVMDAMWNFFAGIPWYAWTVIVVMVCGVIVTALKGKSRGTST